MILLLEKLNEDFRRMTRTSQFSGLSVCIQNQARSLGHIIGRWSQPRDLIQTVKRHKPQVIISEGFKLSEGLVKHIKSAAPQARIYIKAHSNIPFLTVERGFFEYLSMYKRENVSIIYNDNRAYEALREYCPSKYLPNIYDVSFLKLREQRILDTINVACFGSIRSLKNQAIQAIAAISLADKIGRKLNFYMNLSRVEGGSRELLTIRNIFKEQISKGHKLVGVPWMEHPALLRYMNETIDLGLQVSLSESFNITAADYTAAGVPIVVSDEIRWAPEITKAPTGDARAIARKAEEILKAAPEIVRLQRENLANFTDNAKTIWRTTDL